MNVAPGASAWLLLLCFSAGLAPAQEWNETQIIERFLGQSPWLREVQARIASARAEAAGRTLLSNPAAVLSREGAGYAFFYQLEQQLPVSGRRGLLKQAGAAAIGVSEAQTAAMLWSLRSDVRAAFYRLLAFQHRESVLADGIRDLEDVIRVLHTREKEGEGSRYDRLRAEREMAEYRSQLAVAHTDVVQARAALSVFLPPGTVVDRLTGALDTPAGVYDIDALVTRALQRRADYLGEQRQVERFRLEQRAADRLRYPEPLAIAGLKRGDVAPGRTETAAAVGITIPLPVFNKGQTEAARFRAEQDAASARVEALERRIRGEVTGAAEALRLRKAAVEQYRNEVNRIGADLSGIVRVAYQEGEAGILELLDSYRITRQARVRLIELEALARESQIDLDRAVGEEVLP